MKKMFRILRNPKTIGIGVLALSVLMQSQGYCDDVKGFDIDLDAETNKVKDLLFGGAIRKVAMTLGFGAGLIQAFMTGSIRPLLIYGGLGLVVCFLPKIIDHLQTF